MPKALKRKLLSVARKRGYGKERTGAFVYGTMRKKLKVGGRTYKAEYQK